MTIEELYTKLGALLKVLPASDFDTVSGDLVAELNVLSAAAEALGMKTGKQLTANMADVLTTRKTSGNTDESVLVRLTALDFYVKKLQTGATEDL